MDFCKFSGFLTPKLSRYPSSKRFSMMAPSSGIFSGWERDIT
jgi:hypothetical protein